MRAISVLAVLGLVFSLSQRPACAQERAHFYEPEQQLLVAMDETSLPDLTPENIVASITGGAPIEGLDARLAFPVDARLMIREPRLPASERLHRPATDQQALLERYVVLTYETPLDASAALTYLEHDGDVLAASGNTRVEFSVAPADPEFSPTNPVVVQNFQWEYQTFPDYALTRTMAFQTAWEKVRGTAYVGHVDFGIQVNHPDLSGAYRPQFAYNVQSNNRQVDEMYSNKIPAGDGTLRAGHGTHTAGIIAANTRHPNLPAGEANYPATGVAGACWWCSLIVVKIRNEATLSSSTADAVAGAYWAVQRGAQVVNLSFGSELQGMDFLQYDCSPTNESVWCAFVTYADYLDVTLVVASGNDGDSYVQLPANLAAVIAVGASMFDTSSGFGNPRWREPSPSALGSAYGNHLFNHGVIAPGHDVLSTTYSNRFWNADIRCGDKYGNGAALDGYGLCTGTSMAAPLISGVAALVKTVDPLQTAALVRSRVFAAGSRAGVPDQEHGFGFVNANSAVASVLATTNRLTPLFSLNSANLKDYFYTVVPQHARAAVLGTLEPQVAGNGIPGYYGYAFVGTEVKPGGNTYTVGANPPLTRLTPKAQVWLFSTHVNPLNAAVDLKPLWRLSYKCGDAIPSGRPNICAAHPYHVDHFYTTDVNELITYKSSHGYLPDGIEGYVYPTTQAQPAGTTTLLRAFKLADDDYAVFPFEQKAAMAALGYTGSLTTLGYVYFNATGARPVY